MVSGNIKAAVKMLGPVAWLAFAAGLQMLGALLFFKAPIDPILISTGALLTFGVYLLNRFTDKEDGYNYPEQKMFFQHKPTLIFFPIVAIVLSFFILAVSSRLVMWHFVLIGGGIFYSISVIPFIQNKSLCFVRLKDILFVKNIIVSILWGVTPFAIAASQKFSIAPSKIDLIIVSAAFCLTTFMTVIACDIHDIEGDRHAGIVTLATFFGKKLNALFLLILGTGGCLFVGFMYLEDKVSLAAMVLFLANIVWTCIAIAPVYGRLIHLSKPFRKPFVDSQLVFNGISLIVLSMCL
jgi:4-hydroxybenzoate polyprenyltransferase